MTGSGPPIEPGPPIGTRLASPPREAPAPPVLVPTATRSAGPPRRTPLAVWSLALALAPWAIGIVVGFVLAVASDPVDPAGGVVALLGLAIIACYVGSVVTGIIGIRRIRRSEGRLTGLGLAGAGLGITLLSIAAGVVLAMARPAGELLRDDFEGPQHFWTGEDATVSKRYANGGYEILVKDPDAISPPSRTFFDEGAVDAVSFSAEATIVSASRDDVAIALGCWQDADSGYVFFIDPIGRYAVANEEGLVTEGVADPLNEPGQVNRLSIACAGGADAGPTTLRLRVNGEEVVRVDDPDGANSFAAVGFHVASADAGALVRFDNALAVEG